MREANKLSGKENVLFEYINKLLVRDGTFRLLPKLFETLSSMSQKAVEKNWPRGLIKRHRDRPDSGFFEMSELTARRQILCALA